ncbi:hypothetical protein B0O80DRAFT_466523 [Mortierella sp. GBAus27b]|nr:hypothetical protein B0O80DRAFT_466523 [Mortierella sp. GBAus27b]
MAGRVWKEGLALWSIALSRRIGPALDWRGGWRRGGEIVWAKRGGLGTSTSHACSKPSVLEAMDGVEILDHRT